ncbi:MAG: hypothetical protein AAFZ67_11345 [Planctomycetota bacterium]
MSTVQRHATTGRTGLIIMADESNSTAQRINTVGSMASVLGPTPTVCSAITYGVNSTLQEACLIAARNDGSIRDLADIAVFGYGNVISSLLRGPLSGQDFVTLPQLAESPKRTETHHQGENEYDVPIWVDTTANGGTPMCRAFRHAATLAQTWTVTNQNGRGLYVLNLTDGEATDGTRDDLLEATRRITKITVGGTPATVFNVNIAAGQSDPIVFPHKRDLLDGEDARTMFDISSILPDGMRDEAARMGLPTHDQSRAMVYNADARILLSAIRIGTMPANLAGEVR